MADTAQLETFAAGVETAVDVPAIERQLHDLWQLAAQSEQDPTRRTITRACLFNLVVYCEDETQREHATATISTLTSRHPCRAIVLLAQSEAPQPELSASLSAHCHLTAGGRKQVCCEQISIVATGPSVTHLSGAVLPLLESDLPTIIWCLGSPVAQGPARLINVADRLLFDTARWPAAIPQLHALLELMDRYPRCSFADLNWTRLRFWREMTAELFDDPQCAGELFRLTSAEIVYGAAPGGLLRALLYAGWLAAQLKWDVARATKRTRLIACEKADAESAGLFSVTLRSAEAEFAIHKNFGEQTATAKVTMPHACSLPHKRAFWPVDDTSLLSQELDHRTPHEVYVRALRMAVELAGRGL